MSSLGPGVTIPTMKSNRSRLAFVVVSICALASLRAVTGPEGAGRDPATRALSIFSEVFSLTRSNYVEPTDSRLLLDGAYDGMSDALDPFSYYVPASAQAAYKAQQASGAASPGIVFARRGGYPYVVGPLSGLPGREGRDQGGRPDRLDRRQAPAQRALLADQSRSRGARGVLVRDRALPGRRREAPDDSGHPRKVRPARALHHLGAGRRRHQDPRVHARDGRRGEEGARRGGAPLDRNGHPRRARLDRRRLGRRGARGVALRRQGHDRHGALAQGRRQGPRRHGRAGLEGPRRDPDRRLDGRAPPRCSPRRCTTA